MSLVRDAGAQPIAEIGVPFKGTWNSISAHQVSGDACWMSHNVFIRGGKLRERPGLARFSDVQFDAAIIGGLFGIDFNKAAFLLAISKNAAYQYIASPGQDWTVASTGIYADDNNGVIDTTFTNSSGQYYGLIASEGYPLRQFQVNVGITAITPTAGTVPSPSSICIASRRIVMLTPPHTITWTPILEYNNYPALAYNLLTNTNDTGICVRPLSSLSFVAYKSRSIHLARAAAGSDAQAFTFAEPIIVEGPAGIRAVVQVSGVHFYMTGSGRVAMFDGTAYPQWIADGLWLFLQADIDGAYASKIFGIYDYHVNAVIFVYPRVGDGGMMRGVVIISLPLEGSNMLQGAQTTQGPSAFLGILGYGLSHGYPILSLPDRVLTFGTTSLRSYTLDEAVRFDDDLSFTSQLQTGLVAMPKMQHNQVSFETMVERADGRGSIMVNAVTSDSLENASGTVDTANPDVIDLNNIPAQEYHAFNIPTRFFGLQFTWDSESTVRYAGTAIYGRVVA